MPIRKSRKYILSEDDSSFACEHYEMDDDSKNGGPNHLKAWREFRRLTQEELAVSVGTTQGQIAHLESERRELSAKWLRRLAPPLNTTPGMLLDHDPNELPSDIIEIWTHADKRAQQQIVEMAKIVAKTGTKG